MDALIQDLRFAFRTLSRRPAFTLVAVLTLMLGIGANTAIFSIVSAVLLRPLPYPDADRITVLERRQGAQQGLLIAIPDVDEWRSRNRTFDDIGVQRAQSVNLTGTETPDRLVGAFVTANTMRVLGARTGMGRLFTDEETAEGSQAQVALLSSATWKNRFGSDSSILGKTVTLDGRPRTVIGVLADSYKEPYGDMEVWLPITAAPSSNLFSRDNPFVWAFGKMKPGVTVEQAQADLDRVDRDLAAAYPATNAQVSPLVKSIRDVETGPYKTSLLIVLGFVGVVLLIACANVANLQLASAVARSREMSLRAALGAGRGRLIRQLLTESVALSIMGGAAGILVAHWAIKGLVGMIPGGLLPAFGTVGLDPMVLGFSSAITLVAGLIFGLAPALHGARADLQESLQLRSAEPVMRRGFDVRNLFVALELALCIMLLVGASLLTRSLSAITRVDPGFDPSHLFTAEFRLPRARYSSDAQVSAFMEHALAQIRAVPGVRSAAFVRSIPLSGNWGGTTYVPDTHPGLSNAEAPPTQQNTVSDGAFKTMGIQVVQGREFNAMDVTGGQPVAVVNEELARRTWPGESALGHRLKIVGPPDVWATVVGVVRNIRQLSLTEPVAAQVYQPMTQDINIFNSIAARTDGDPMALAKTIRAALWSVDPEQPMWKMRSMESLMTRDVAPPRFTMLLTASFALLALVLAVIGVYGVMSYAVAQRTREVGIRMALGARRADVVRLMLQRGLRVVGVAVALGMLASLGAGQLIRKQLYGVGAADPMTFAAVPLILATVALIACYLPARRAARVDPAIALKDQ
ncbi:MAG TPA: ABC transporter permease [Gemmatimonadales bacterium]|jgi:putative ABC transport system permease protein